MAKNKKTPTIKKKRFTLALSPAEVLGWSALLVFICGCFFVLGIFVGRGLVPVPGENDPIGGENRFRGIRDRIAVAQEFEGRTDTGEISCPIIDDGNHRPFRSRLGRGCPPRRGAPSGLTPIQWCPVVWR